MSHNTDENNERKINHKEQEATNLASQIDIENLNLNTKIRDDLSSSRIGQIGRRAIIIGYHHHSRGRHTKTQHHVDFFFENTHADVYTHMVEYLFA